MKDKYIVPNIDVISIVDNDVVATSPCIPDFYPDDRGCPEDDSCLNY